MNDKNNPALKFWTGPWPIGLSVVLLAGSVWLGFFAQDLLGRTLTAVSSIAGALAAFILLSTAMRVRKAVKDAADRPAPDASAPQAEAVAGPQTTDGDDEGEDGEEEYEFPFLRLMDSRSRLYTCCETRSWYAIQFQTVATASVRGDKLAPSWFPGDVDHDYAAKQDIWIAKSDLTSYELDPFPVSNLPWPNSGTLTLTAGGTKHTFALLGEVDEEDLEEFFRR